MPRLIRPAFERWNEKVERTDGCWLWQGAIKENGYGVMQRGARGQGLVRAHRFAYEHYVGQVPPGLDIRHTCHVRHCVNPAHLLVGTRLENMRDMVEADRYPRNKRMPRGEANARSKLSEADVRKIRADPRILREIAADYGVTIPCIWSVRRGATWRHIT